MMGCQRDSEHGGVQPLLQPVCLGDLHLPNRVVMAPTTRARATNAELAPTELQAAYYAQRASAGLIIAEGAWVSEQAIGFSNVAGIYSEQQVAAWRQVTSTVHALGGRIVLQLWHAGTTAHPDHRGGALPAGPSAINPHEIVSTTTGRKETFTPRAMTRAEIGSTVADYAAAAERARRAGFDGVEIAANGSSLIPQFLNRRLNQRTDSYGTHRSRLLLEIVDAVVAVWDGLRVGVRLSPYWTAADRSSAGSLAGEYCYAADEQTLAEYDDLVAALNGRRLAYLHLRGRALSEANGVPDQAEFDRYRRRFEGPLIVNHGFDRDTGNAIVRAGIADAVSFARLFIANPDLVSRFALGHSLASSDRGTYYSGGARGYLDYPIWSGPREMSERPAPLVEAGR